MHKPARKPVEDDLPSLDSDGADDEEEEPWSSGIDDLSDDDAVVSGSEPDSVLSASSDSRIPRRKKPKQNSDSEMPYEAAPRKRRPSWEAESDKEKAVERLPIKTADGRIQKSGAKIIMTKAQESDDGEEDPEDAEESTRRNYPPVEDVSTGARFGRPAVVDVIGNKSRKARIQAAKEQIAGI